MPRICSQCQQSSSLHDFVCSHCGVELVDNGELLSALDLNDNSAKPQIIPTIGAWIVAAASGFLAKFLS
jgi:predicted amidophosphoribosyltransferase